jgi:ubiquinone/menaquinone biosynthesis C-methylase UbiE
MEPQLQRRVQRYGWDKAAKFYDNSWKEQLRPAQDKLLEMAQLQPGEFVLETSCGTGQVTIRAARQIGNDGELTATDISEKMIEEAEKLSEEMGLSNIRFRRMDAEELDFDDNRFDSAICSLGLMYFPFPVKALKEMYRVLKPGGRAVAAIWGERKNCGWADIFPIVDARVASDVCPMFFQQGTGNTVRYSFETAGFENISVERMSVSLNYPDKKTALMAAFDGGAVALAYQKFDDQTKKEIHREYLDSIESFRVGEGYAIPGEFVVVAGRKVV